MPPHRACASTPRVSVVVPTFNRLPLLREAIETVERQSWRGFELIVVDNGSTDGTAAWLRSRADLHCIQHARPGAAGARNAGIRAASGELICFLDSDDLWEPEKLARQIAYLDAHPEYGLIATEIAPFDNCGPVPARKKSRQYRIRTGLVARHLLFANWIQTSTVIVRRQCLEKVGVFDEEIGNFGEDWQLWVRIACEYEVGFLREPLVRYRVHGDSLTTTAWEESQFQSLMLALDKLASLPLFRQHPSLISKARYRICVHRAWRNIAGGERTLASSKLRYACQLQSFPFRAWMGLLHLALTTGLAAEVGA